MKPQGCRCSTVTGAAETRTGQAVEKLGLTLLAEVGTAALLQKVCQFLQVHDVILPRKTLKRNSPRLTPQ